MYKTAILQNKNDRLLLFRYHFDIIIPMMVMVDQPRHSASALAKSATRIISVRPS